MMSAVLVLVGIATLLVGFFGSVPRININEPAILNPIMSFFLGILATVLICGGIHMETLEDARKKHEELAIKDDQPEK